MEKLVNIRKNCKLYCSVIAYVEEGNGLGMGVAGMAAGVVVLVWQQLHTLRNTMGAQMGHWRGPRVFAV